MAASIYQLPRSGLAASTAEEDDIFRDRNHKPTAWYPDFKHKASREPLWMDIPDTPSWVAAQPRSCGFSGDDATSTGSRIDAFVSSLRVCTVNKDLHRGTHIHHDLLQMGLLDKCVDALVTMYAKCGALEMAKVLLDMHKSSDAITWTALIAGYSREERAQDALDCFEQMKHEGILPDAVTYSSVLKACAMIGAMDKGKEIHDEILRQGLLQHSSVLGAALVDMYAKNGALSMAQHVLEGLPSRDAVAWSALIIGYAREGQYEEALTCFENMQQESILPNAVTYVCILKACATIGAADKGKQIHDAIVRQGLLQNHIVLGSALVDMYVKCGVLSMAHRVLEELPSRNVVSWSALIAGYAQEGQAEEAINCFEQMQLEGILPNAVTYTCILKACATKGAVDKGRRIHHAIVRQGLLQNNIVLGSALVDMYAKCGSLSMAQRILEGLPCRNVVSWSALIAGYAQEGQAEEALNCFKQMHCEGILPNAVTYASILKAYATVGDAMKGKEIHDEIVRLGLLQDDIVLGNALVDMYAKCGALSMAHQVLEGLPSRDVVTWSALIAGYAQEGQAEHVLNCFEQMHREGIRPDVVTFSSALNVCSHLGLVEEGQALFMSMSTKYDVKPDLECYTCMVDLFGRAGHLEKAIQLIEEMPSSDYSVIWLALLGACRKWGDINVGRWAFEKVVQLEKSNGPPYILMANIYATAGMHEEARKIEAMRIRNKAWKQPECSWWVDANNVAHACFVRDIE